MSSELTKVKAKIKALAAKTLEAGCSEHEAMQAAEMVGRLLEQYNLSMDEIDISEEVCVIVDQRREIIAAMDHSMYMTSKNKANYR